MVPVVPDLMVTQLVRQYGADTAGEITRGFSAARPVTLRVNPLRSGRDEVRRTLGDAGIEAQSVSWYDDALILPHVREDTVRALPLYDAGGIYLQSLSAMIPALLMQPQKGESILDMAAAPGGKTTQMAALSGGGALITACEKNAVRAQRLQFNLQRQGAGRCTVMNTDARQLSDLFAFDKILLDAPCTGSGTLLLTEGQPQRRMDEAWVKKTVSTQKAMLQKALKLLRRGGTMVYSTCSVMEMENEGVLRAVLPACKAEIIPVPETLCTALPTLPTTLEGTLCIRPTALYEGFFVAVIRKP